MVRGHRPLSWVTSAAVVVIAMALLHGCTSEEVTPGPGPLEPVGPVGEEEGIPGSGSIASEQREVASFDQIRFVSEGTVDVRFAPTESLAIEADDNLLQYLETSVVDGVLQIETTESVDIDPSQPPQFTIQVVDLSAIEFSGAGSMSVDSMSADAFDVVFAGAGNLSIDDLTVDELNLNLIGVGAVRLAGTARVQNAVVTGVVEYDGGDLATASTSVDAAGTTSTLVWVTDELTVDASDLAEVRYYGAPTTEIETRNSASVSPLGPR